MTTKKQGIKFRYWFAMFIFFTIIINLFILSLKINNSIISSMKNIHELNIANFFDGNNKRINILIFGVDAVDNETTSGKRSDSIMIFSMDSNGNNPSLISIPRDTRVPIEGRKSQEKINHAHAYGSTELLKSTIENFLDITIDYYARVNYQAVEQLVDTLGGLELDVPMDMKYDDPYDDPPLEIDIKKGLQTLDGRNTLHFLRFRKGYANQDLGRIEAQKQFAEAMINKIKSPTSIFKIPKLTKVFYDNVDTDIPKTKIFHIGIKNLFKGLDNIEKTTLPGKPATINGVSYYIANDEDIKQLRKNYLTVSSSLKNNYPKIAVLNACGVQGIAAKISEKLNNTDIIVDSIGNYKTANVQESFIEYHREHKKQAKKISKILGINKLIEIEDNDTDVIIIIGKDLAST